MYVTEQLNHLMVKVIGKAEKGEMIENDRPTLDDEDFLVVNAVEPLNEGPVPEYSLRVMVTENKVDMTVKSSRLQTPVPFLNIAETEVPKVIYMVIGLDNRVPVIHKSLIHLFNRPKRPVAILKDIFMEKMS